MKLLFLQDNGLNESLGVMSLAASIKADGHDCQLLVDAEEKDLLAEVSRAKPDIVAISCTTPQHGWLTNITDRIKKNFKLPIVVGGAHPTCYPEIIKNAGIDIICRGEGEKALTELLDHIQNNEDITNIKNLWVKKDVTIYQNDMRPLVQNLDELPLPDRSIYYDRYKFMREMSVKRFITGRGCPFSCSFCHINVLKEVNRGKGNFIRSYSPERVIREITNVKNTYPIKTVHFSDDLFGLNKRWTLEFLELYKREIPLPFTCNIRADFISEDIAKALKEARCHGVTFGIETGNEKIRNNLLGKRLSNADIFRGTALLKAYKIKFLTTNILALPGETLDDAIETVMLNRKLSVDFTRARILEAYPNLPLTLYAEQAGFLGEHLTIENYKQNPKEPVFKSSFNNEFKNIGALFHILTKFPVPESIIRLLVRVPYNWLYALIGKMQIYQEVQFFQIDLWSGINYYLHTFKSVKFN